MKTKTAMARKKVIKSFWTHFGIFAFIPFGFAGVLTASTAALGVDGSTVDGKISANDVLV